MKKFNHLNIPDKWQQYWTRYPQGYTILEALINWVSQVDDMVDSQNKLTDNVSQFRKEIDEFIAQFDDNLQGTVTDTLRDWQESGFLDIVIDQALETKYHEMDERLTTQLTEAVDDVNSRGVNVRTLGIEGDGSTDVTVELQSAFNQHTDVFFPSGDYVITNTLDASNLKSLTFSQNARIIIKNDVDGLIIHHRMMVRGLHLNVSSAGYNSAALTIVKDLGDGEIRGSINDLTIYNDNRHDFKGTGVLFRTTESDDGYAFTSGNDWNIGSFENAILVDTGEDSWVNSISLKRVVVHRSKYGLRAIGTGEFVANKLELYHQISSMTERALKFNGNCNNNHVFLIAWDWDKNRDPYESPIEFEESDIGNIFEVPNLKPVQIRDFNINTFFGRTSTQIGSNTTIQGALTTKNRVEYIDEDSDGNIYTAYISQNVDSETAYFRYQKNSETIGTVNIGRNRVLISTEDDDLLIEDKKAKFNGRDIALLNNYKTAIDIPELDGGDNVVIDIDFEGVTQGEPVMVSHTSDIPSNLIVQARTRNNSIRITIYNPTNNATNSIDSANLGLTVFSGGLYY